MTTKNTTPAPTTKVSRTLTDSELATVQNALNMLHGVLGSAEFGKSALPHFGACTLEQQGFVLARTLDAIKAKDAEAHRAAVAGVKGKVDALCHDARTAKIRVWRKTVALCAADPDMAEVVGDKVKPTTETYITVADAEDAFPENTKASDIPSLLIKMGYKLGASPTKKEEDRRIVVAIAAEHLAPVAQAAE